MNRFSALTAPEQSLLRSVPALLVLALVLVWPLLFDGRYEQRLFTLAGIQIILVLGYQLVFGHAGALSLAQGCFFGLGAYVAAILSLQAGEGGAAPDFLLVLPLSILAPVLLAAIVARPVLRLETHYFALATLGLGQIGLIIALEWQDVTGGANGLFGIPSPSLLGFGIPRGPDFMGLVWGCVALACLASWWITRGRKGRTLTLLRDAPMIAAAMGYDAGRSRFLLFLASAAFGGAAGALHVHSQSLVSPAVLQFDVLVTCLAMTVIGGRTRIGGAFLGALLLLHLPEWFRFLEDWSLFAYGAVLLLTILLAPGGLYGLLEYAWRKLCPGAFAPSAEPLTDSVPRVDSLPEKDATPPSSAPLLQVRGLYRAYGGVTAVQDLSFALFPGRILGMIGPNGSGKTTAVNLLSGMDRPDRGEILLSDASEGGKGKELSRLPLEQRARSGLQRCFQTPAFPPGLTVADCLELALTAPSRLQSAGHLSGQQERSERISACLQRLELLEERHRLPGDLPAPLLRRLDLARAVIVRPRLLLLDEPAAGLPPADIALLRRIVQEEAARGCAILLIDHNMAFLSSLADALICLDQGQCLAEGSPREVLQDPAVQKAYFGQTQSHQETGA